jgi:hypothetical protein
MEHQNHIDIKLTKKCLACSWEEQLFHRKEERGKHDPESITFHSGSRFELRADLRFICCEKCGNPVMHLIVEGVDPDS